jgi:hypothetical protein
VDINAQIDLWIIELTLDHTDHYHKVKRQMPAGKGGFPPAGFPPPFGPFEVPRAANISHKSNLTIINPSQADWALLGQNKSVVLSPETGTGPFCKLDALHRDRGPLHRVPENALIPV